MNDRQLIISLELQLKALARENLNTEAHLRALGSRTLRPPECSTCDCPAGRRRDHVFGCGCVLCSCERFAAPAAAPMGWTAEDIERLMPLLDAAFALDEARRRGR